jgi:arginyl-tRNA synthetase
MKNPWLFLKNDIAKSLSVSIDELEEPEKYGDFAYPCFNLAKKQGKNPNEIAKNIAVTQLQLAEKVKIKFFNIKATGPYVNYYINWEEFGQELLKNIDKNYGKPEKIEKKKIMVEHTSANPNKALHVGHIRNSCLGDSLVRLLDFLGHDVIVANYIDDTGDQMAELVLGFKFLNIPIETEMKFDQYCGDEVYVNVNKMYETKPELLEKKKFITKKIEEGNNEIADFSDQIARKVLLEQLKTCWRMNIYYDLLNKESDIIQLKLWKKAFEILKEKNLIYQATDREKKGCWLLNLSDLPEFKGSLTAYATLTRSDETVVYTGKDIAYAMWKHGLLKEDFKYSKFIEQPNGKILWTTISKKWEEKHPEFRAVDTSIAVIDVRQSYYQDSVKAALKLISGKELNYIHYGYELVSLSSNTAKQLGIDTEKGFVHMAGRKGWFVNTDTVLDILFKKALEETKKRNPDSSEDFLKEVAEKIAVGALRYELEKISPEKIIVFDIDEALKLEGNAAPYLQYTYTRASSILKKIDKIKDFDANYLKDQKEINVLKLLAKYPDILEKAVKDLRPHYLANYLYELSDAFNQFYQSLPVLKSEENLRNARLKLVDSVKTVLKSGLYLLGIPIMEKM